MRATYFILVLLVSFLLGGSHAAYAQDVEEATALTQQVIKLAKQRHYSEAASLAQRALAIREKALGPDHLDVAGASSNLAIQYTHLGRYRDAEALYRRALAIREKVLGAD